MIAFCRLWLLFSIFASLAQTVSAQSLGGVFSPVVNEGHQSAQFRTGYAPETEKWGHRLHYQRAINGTFMWRGIVQARESADSDFDFDSVGAELFWQLTDDAQAWQSGLRFDLRLRDEERPHAFGVNWMNQWSLNPDWHLRSVILTSIDFGDTTRDGVFVQSRGQLNRRLDGGRAVGLQIYSVFGSSADFRDFEDQSYEIGPYYAIPLGEHWSLWSSALVGLNDASPDSNLKLWLTRRF